VSPIASQDPTPVATPRSALSMKSKMEAISEEINEIAFEKIMNQPPFIRIDKDFNYLENDTFEAKRPESNARHSVSVLP